MRKCLISLIVNGILIKIRSLKNISSSFYKTEKFDFIIVSLGVNYGHWKNCADNRAGAGRGI